MNFNKKTLIALTGFPAAASSWSGPSYYSTGPTMRLIRAESPYDAVLRRQRALAQRMFDNRVKFSSNRYELIDNDEKFQLTVEVPGIKEEDLDIKLDEGQLTIKGQRYAESETSRFSSRFAQSFYLDPTVDVDHFTATLKDGMLVVSAPKDVAKLEENVRRIPITPLEDILAEPEQKEDVPISSEGGADAKIPVESQAKDDAN